MDMICLTDVKSLIQYEGGPRVSLFMPTHHQGGMDQQDPIRFRNLLRTAEGKLVERGMRHAEVRLLLRPLEKLVTDNLFWRQQSDGLAVFADANQYLYYRVPSRLKEEVGVGKRFLIRPLISLSSQCGIFYLLAISQSENRLLQCNEQHCVRIKLEDLPQNISSALNIEPEKRFQYHVVAPVGGSNVGGSTTIQFGSGSRADYLKKEIQQYFEQINKAVMKYLKEEDAPLVLAGVAYLHPLYRMTNKYHNLLSEGISGSPEGISDGDLRKQAWLIVQPYFVKTQKEGVAELGKAAATGLSVSNIREVLMSAYRGRVRFLFISENAQKWGTFNNETNEVAIHFSPGPKDDDLIDLAAFQTLKNAGTIFLVKPEEIPGKEPIAAILRY